MEVWFGKDLEQLVVDLALPEVGGSLLQKGESFKQAPHTLPVRRLDDVKAARQLDVRYRFDDVA